MVPGGRAAESSANHGHFPLLYYILITERQAAQRFYVGGVGGECVSLVRAVLHKLYHYKKADSPIKNERFYVGVGGLYFVRFAHQSSSFLHSARLEG